jgi:Tfp pilus assembly protein PilP
MADNASPEERLFKIIQNGKNTPPGKQDSAGAKPKKSREGVKRLFTGLNLFKPPLPGRTTFRPGGAVALPAALRAEDLKTINRVLALVLACVTALVFYYFMNKRLEVSELTARVSDVPFQRKKAAIEPFKPLPFYLEGVKERDIFSPAAEKAEEGRVTFVPEKEAKKKLEGAVATLKLQGISWGKTPKAMIMSEADGQVYFLTEGQMVGTSGVKIKTITRNKVILVYESEEMELL